LFLLTDIRCNFLLETNLQRKSGRNGKKHFYSSFVKQRFCNGITTLSKRYRNGPLATKWIHPFATIMQRFNLEKLPYMIRIFNKSCIYLQIPSEPLEYCGKSSISFQAVTRILARDHVLGTHAYNLSFYCKTNANYTLADLHKMFFRCLAFRSQYKTWLQIIFETSYMSYKLVALLFTHL
jgi:hypothetical protein